MLVFLFSNINVVLANLSYCARVHNVNMCLSKWEASKCQFVEQISFPFFVEISFFTSFLFNFCSFASKKCSKIKRLSNRSSCTHITNEHVSLVKSYADNRCQSKCTHYWQRHHLNEKKDCDVLQATLVLVVLFCSHSLQFHFINIWKQLSVASQCNFCAKNTHSQHFNHYPLDEHNKIEQYGVQIKK